jgi:thiaminase/transcriptional activator TenA
MASLAPCALGYGEIGMRLKAQARGTQYADWINAYSGDDYQKVCRSVGALIDRGLERRLGADYAALPRWTRLTARFAAATRLEVGFWDMGMRGA